MRARPALPSGTVTFLFTDIEGSTRLLHELGPDRYADALATHRRVLRDAFSAHSGVEVDTQGDAFFVAFPTAAGSGGRCHGGHAHRWVDNARHARLGDSEELVNESDSLPYRLRAGEGRRLWAFGDLMILKATADQTSGRVFVMEQHVPRHRGAPGRHVHERDDQSWFVIAGRGRWFIGGQAIEAGPGDFIHGPHGMPHAFSADTDDLHVLVITAPAGLEGFFAAVGTDATEPTHPPADLDEPPEDPDLAKRYGITALGPEPSWTPLAE